MKLRVKAAATEVQSGREEEKGLRMKEEVEVGWRLGLGARWLEVREGMRSRSSVIL